MGPIRKSVWSRETAFPPDSVAHPLRTRPSGDAWSRAMSAPDDGSRTGERTPGGGTHRLAPLPEGSCPAGRRGDPPRDPGDGLHDRTRDHRTAPRTVLRARRSAFRGMDAVFSGRARVSAALQAARSTRSGQPLRTAGCEVEPGPESGSPAAPRGAQAEYRAQTAPAGRRRARPASNRCGISDGYAPRRAARTRNCGSRITLDNCHYRA